MKTKDSYEIRWRITKGDPLIGVSIAERNFFEGVLKSGPRTEMKPRGLREQVPRICKLHENKS